MISQVGILFLSAFIFAFSLMAVVWLTSLRIQNAGIVDIAWVGGFFPVALLYLIFGQGFIVRRGLIFAMVSLWSLRLAAHLYRRVMGHHPQEDGRYQELRRKWKEDIPLKFFLFFEFQAFLLTVLSVPFLLASTNPKPSLSALEGIAFLLWCVAWLGETLADQQLARFKRDPANKGKVCQEGLWFYSRHPNYFFEWLNWCAYFLFACASPYGLLTIYCPLAMLYFLFRVTGIPMTEAQSLRTKAEEYRRYQETTSVFVPWFRRKI